MYFSGDTWNVLDMKSLTPVAFSAFIVLPSASTDEIKLFIIGGLERDSETKTFTKKSSTILLISQLANELEMIDLVDNDGEVVSDYSYDNQVIEVLDD